MTRDLPRFGFCFYCLEPFTPERPGRACYNDQGFTRAHNPCITKYIAERAVRKKSGAPE